MYICVGFQFNNNRKKDKEVGRNIESMVEPETYKEEVNVKKVCRNVL